MLIHHPNFIIMYIFVSLNVRANENTPGLPKGQTTVIPTAEIVGRRKKKSHHQAKKKSLKHLRAHTHWNNGKQLQGASEILSIITFNLTSRLSVPSKQLPRDVVTSMLDRK